MTKLEGMKPPMTPTFGQTRPERLAGPLSANQTGQARSTSAHAEPDGQSRGGVGERARTPPGSVTSAAATNASTQTTTTTTTMASSSEERKNCANSSSASTTPAPRAPWRWRTRISSRTARISGSSMSAAVIRWANSRLDRTKGEKP